MRMRYAGNSALYRPGYNGDADNVPAKPIMKNPSPHEKPHRSENREDIPEVFRNVPRLIKRGYQISRLATFSALLSINSRRGSTTSPIKVLNT